MKDSTFIKRVILKNYKSIAACDVQLQPLTFLVGRNGSGKSNFLDALRFVADALNTSLDYALRDRGGISDVCYRSSEHPNHINISFEFTLPKSVFGYYGFSIDSRSRGRYVVQTEECRVQRAQNNNPEVYFRIDNGKTIDTSVKVAPAAVKDRLYLVNASGLPEFRPIYDAFSQMRFYNLNPDIISDLQDPDSGDMLMQDGSNITSVIKQLSSDVKENIEEYLKLIVPNIAKVHSRKFGPKESLQFKQYVGKNKRPLIFYPNNMSDGTIRALGILVALFQGEDNFQKCVPLVGIEEPEIALHPAASGVLLDAIRDAAYKKQVIITSHSPDLLDNKDLNVESILAVEAHDGTTAIAPIDDASRSVIKDRLFTTGELLRLDQLQPDPISVEAAAKTKQPTLTDFLKNENIRIDKKKQRTDDL